jgi:hypothetical protein
MLRIATTTNCRRYALFTVPQRLYAKNTGDTRKFDPKTGREETEIKEAMLDYLRIPKKKWRKPNTPKQFAQEGYLANQFSRWMKQKKFMLREEALKKHELAMAAYETLPDELKREAAKGDWMRFPEELAPVYYRLPPQPNYNPPLEPLRNEL